jgi:hypothetical protein
MNVDNKQNGIAETLMDTVAGNHEKTQEWLSYMFANEPIAACIKDFCATRNYTPEQLYQLVSLGFMMQKIDRMKKEYDEHNSAETVEA